MLRLSRPRVRVSIKNFPRHRPALERLEPRLPPGDAFLGMLLSLPDSPIETHEIERDIDSSVKLKRERAIDLTTSPLTLFEDTGHTAMTAIEPSSSPTTDPRAAGLDTAGLTAGINPAARHVHDFGTHEAAPSSFIDPRVAGLDTAVRPVTIAQRTAGLDPAGLTAGINPAARQESAAPENYGNLPLTFEANHGQTDAGVDFITRAGGGTVFLTPTAAVFAYQNSPPPPSGGRKPAEPGTPQGADAPRSEEKQTGVAIHLQIVGANPDAQPTGINRQPGIVNYFIGNDPNQWHANIPTFGGVRYDDVYPGIDLAYYSAFSRDRKGALEYDFIVSPGADPNAITLNFAGADGVEINKRGDLVLHTSVGDVVQQKPFTYQDIGKTRQEVASGYVLDGTQVRFEAGAYDVTRPLVIDPLVLGYSTYLGGSPGDDYGLAIAVDAAGNTYVTGSTKSTNFPTTPGVFEQDYNGGGSDTFVAKLSPNGTSLVYGTYLGGIDRDVSTAITVDAAGNAYVTGYTFSNNFPTTPGAFDTNYNGSKSDAFVAKLSADGVSLAYGTYLGGDSNDDGKRIAVDAANNAYVSGYTGSPNFPTTAGAFDTGFNGNSDAFVAKLSADGTSLSYGTYLGGSSNDYSFGIAVDATGNAYMSGYTSSPNFPTTAGAFDTGFNGLWDAFVAKLSADGTSLGYGCYLGGTGEDLGDGIAVDGAGNAYVTGKTTSSDFPTTPGAFDTSYNDTWDAFIAKVSADGASLGYGTYLGGSEFDGGYAIAVNAVGDAYVSGSTHFTDFPTTPGAFDTSFNGVNDAFVAKLSADGASLVYGTYLGGSSDDRGHDITVDAAGNAYVSGQTDSANFPTTPGALKRRNRGWSDAFVTKFAEV